jgi:N-acetylneuraminic acid mutarotase
MRTVVIALGLVCLMGAILAQNVGIGTSTPDPTARLDVSDNQRGILIPRLTTAERDAITNPAPARSLLIYNTDCNEYQYYIPGTGWVSILTNVTAGGGGSGTLTAFPATGISASGFTAHWSPVAGATGYKVRVYQDCGSSTVVATATFPAGSTSGPVSVSMPCDQARCYEVEATVSSSSCGTAASLLISNRVPVVRTPPNPCTTPNTWVRLPNPPATMPLRQNHVSIAHNGFIYVGFGGNSGCLNDWWRWDPCSGTWTQLASPPVTFGFSPFIFAIGSYIYVGGGGCGGPINSFYRYDPATNTWTARANLPLPLQGAPGASDGTYGYVACGVTTGGTYSSTLYRYDPSTDSWTNLSIVPGGAGRFTPSMAYYQGKLYIGGGSPNPASCSRDFYVYDIAMNNWTTLPNHPTTHNDGWAVAYNGKIYVTGEHAPCCCTCTNQFYSYNIASNAWSSMPVFPGGGRNNFQLVELNGVLYGGWGHNCSSPDGQFTTYIRDWWAFCP